MCEHGCLCDNKPRWTRWKGEERGKAASVSKFGTPEIWLMSNFVPWNAYLLVNFAKTTEEDHGESSNTVLLGKVGNNLHRRKRNLLTQISDLKPITSNLKPQSSSFKPHKHIIDIRCAVTILYGLWVVASVEVVTTLVVIFSTNILPIESHMYNWKLWI